MKKNPFIRVLLMSILAGLVVASAGMASAGRLAFIRTSAEKSTVRHESTTCDPDDEGTDEGTSDEQGASDDEGTSQDEGSSKECEEPDEGDDSTTDPGEGDGTTTPPPVDPAAREAECKAAGQSTVADGTTAGGTQTEVKKKGLDHAIEVVLANCIKNPQSQGLLNALRHLVANRDRHLAHQAEKDARRAAREAAKAARKGSHGHGHGTGSD
jgi:hypothetical protein